jgi:general secretion pathway protein D
MNSLISIPNGLWAARQYPKLQARALRSSSLGFGIWNFSGVWCLVFGVFSVACLSLPAQAPPTPNTNRDAALRESFRQLGAGKTNATLPTATTNPAPSTPRTTPRVIPPLQPGSIIVPSEPAAITPTNAAVVITVPPGATNAPAEEIIPAGGLINFQGADLKQVLDIYAMLVNRTILRASTLPATPIYLTTQTPLTKSEAIQALDAVLGMSGVTMINFGDKFVKAEPVATANTVGAPFDHRKAEQFPELGPYVTHVVPLKYAKPTELVQILQPFVKIPNAILPVDSTQILVLRDFTENVKRMLEMIKAIDIEIPSEFESEVIPIKYTIASDIASAINSLSSGGGGATVGASTTGTRASIGSRGTGSGGFGRPGGIGTGTYPGQTGVPGMVNPPGTPATATTPGSSSFTDRLRGIINRAATSGEIVVLGQTKIIADERTNALLIYASHDDMKKIKDIISKLDVVLPQVLIEAYVIQVTIGDSKDFGISYLQRPQTSGNLTGVGAINNTKGFLSPSDFISGGTGTNGGSGSVGSGLPGGFSYLARYNNDLDIVLNAVARDNRARILQRPRIQTSHAVQAQLFVGQSRPYPTASYYGGGAYGGYSSIQQLQIGVTLDVTPLINPEGLVVMDIHQTIESYDGDVDIANVGKVPITSRKEASAKVAVRDHDTIILGGLIEDDNSKSGSGVPWLMDIPVLGHLFRSTSSSKARSELIVLLRPTVLPTPEIAALAAKTEKDKMPGVKAAEWDFQQDDNERIKRQRKEELKHFSDPSTLR